MLTDVVVRENAQGVAVIGFSEREKRFEKDIREPSQIKAWRAVLSPYRIDGHTNWQLYVADHDCRWTLVELPSAADTSLLLQLLREAVRAKEEDVIFWRHTGFEYDNLVLYAVCIMKRPSYCSIFKRLGGVKQLLPEIMLKLPDDNGIGSLQTETGDIFLALDEGNILFAAPYRDQERIAEARQRLHAAGFVSHGEKYWASGKQAQDIMPLEIDKSYGFDVGDVVLRVTKRQRAIIGAFILAACLTAALNIQAHHLEEEVNRQAIDGPTVSTVETSAEPSLHCGALAVYAEKKLPKDVTILDWFAKENELLLRGQAQSASTLIEYCRYIEKSGLVHDTRLYNCRQTDKALIFELALHPKEGN